ncbi:MAG: ribose-phosphate pyrophosphokinase [Clostridia bacterium]|nr:ribose-phosphate pyrophosphokinase [Clostridia bacterium]
MSVSLTEYLDTIPQGRLGIIAMKGCEDLAKRVSDQILECRAQFQNASTTNLHLKGYHRDSYIIKANFPRFATGEGKAVITESIRGYDLFIITDCFNYNVTYKMYNLKDANGEPLQVPMSPDDHFADLKRVISACAGKAKRITVVMPMLYEGRQHRRTARESLDCALALQELENMGVSNIITIDAHDPRVQNSIRIGFESVAPTYQMIKAIAKSLNNNIKFSPENTMMIAPDEGAMGRCVYYAQVLGVELGMFYKRRDYATVIDGRNPIVSHEFLGDNVEGKDVIVVDDMISSGDSMIDVCKQLKALKAKRIFVFSSFGLFTSGLERFDKAFEEGLFDKIFTTNVVYQTPELLTRDWYYSVDMSKYLALIIDTLNHDRSVSPFLNPIQKINDYIEKYNLK